MIVEDERSAVQQLKSELEEVQGYQFIVLGELETIREAREYLVGRESPDLIFMDIQLADGLSLDLFNRMVLPCPVIFCTAYDRYAVEAFHLDAIDYLLKPIESKKLQRAIDIFNQKADAFSPKRQYEQLQEVLSRLDTSRYRSSFLIHTQHKMLLVQTRDISYFSLRNRKVCITTKTNREYLIDQSLDQLDKQLDPTTFFRANRQVIISKSSVQAVEPYGLAKLLLDLTPVHPGKVIISKEKVPAFKQWANS